MYIYIFLLFLRFDLIKPRQKAAILSKEENPNNLV